MHIKKSIQCTTAPLNELLHLGETIDFRLKETKWEDLRPGDYIEYWEDFTGWQKEPAHDSRKVKVQILKIYGAGNFSELLKLIEKDRIVTNDKDAILKSLRIWWREDQEKENGVLGFHIVIV